jgi:hemoglobin-like flavoprotein
MQALRFAVDCLEQPRELQCVLQSLGRRHAHYGVQERHYDTVGLALIDTLGQLLGPIFTAEAREAWLALYTQIADSMKQAAAEGQGTLSNVRPSGPAESSAAPTSRAPQAE